jgi:hypothetical protein
MDEVKCKKVLPNRDRMDWGRTRHCTRKPWKDGFCKQHHPDTVKKRQDDSMAAWKAKLEISPGALLAKAQADLADLRARLEEAERERDRLKGALEEIADYPNRPKHCIYVDYSCRLLEIARKALERGE